MKNDFEASLIKSGEIIKRGAGTLLENLGKIIALLTAIIAALVIFTEISFSGFGTERVTTTLFVILGASYIIYFSLEDAGERAARSSESYIAVSEEYRSRREKIRGEDIEELRAFCSEYTERELEYRRREFLFAHGLGPGGYSEYLSGKDCRRSERRIYKRARALRPVPLTPAALLSDERGGGRSELRSPEGDKLLRFTLRLIPTTLCMIFTVSVALNLRDGLTAESIIEGVLKLSTLPLAAYKGYTGGWGYVSGPLSDWQRTRADILDAFLGRKCKQELTPVFLSSET
ncbi:MAG: hypothetical protein IKA64_00570 [Clostridia bacterium]|nr:hypothetical protein [Clostridia bacterium]